MNIIEQLTALRKEQHLSQEKLSTLAGLGKNTMSRLESGGQGLTLKTLTALAGALGYRIEIKFVAMEDEDENV